MSKNKTIKTLRTTHYALRTAIILLPFFIIGTLFSKEITLGFLNSKPRSIYKDYYIWRYLDQNISSKTALKLLGEAKRVNRKLFIKFAKKIDDKSYKKILKCYKMKPKEFLKSDADCIKIGFSSYDATKLSHNDLVLIDKKVSKKYPKLHNIYQILLSKKPFLELLKSDKDTFFETFNNVGSLYREKNFNHILDKNFLKAVKNDKRFNQSIKLIATDMKLDRLQCSLLDINSSNLSAKTNFFLFLNALRHNKKKLAKRYLFLAKNKFYFKFDKDKTLFWQYLVYNDLEVLYQLTKSFDANIYSLYALEKLGVKPSNIKVIKKCSDIKSSVNITKPFKWLQILSKINKKDTNLTKLSKKFSSCDELPVKSFILERENFKEYNYFILPYYKYLQKYPKDKQALLLAVARQESRFIPSSISSSYALGMMQFMPFLAKATAKQKKIKNFDLDDMFKPKISYNFAYDHLNYLQKKLKHPLFIAYAYNGGIGFTKRMLKNGLFKKGIYEPFLSMELVPYDESRRYAKKVLANYIIYKNILGEKVSIKTLLKKLDRPFCVVHFQK